MGPNPCVNHQSDISSEPPRLRAPKGGRNAHGSERPRVGTLTGASVDGSEGPAGARTYAEGSKRLRGMQRAPAVTCMPIRTSKRRRTGGAFTGRPQAHGWSARGSVGPSRNAHARTALQAPHSAASPPSTPQQRPPQLGSLAPTGRSERPRVERRRVGATARGSSTRGASAHG